MPVKIIGKKTAIVVSVAATTAEPPRLCRSVPPLDGLALFFLRTMFSSTTVELSTSMPTASAMPPSDMMFSDKSFGT